jgi:hypothetical protein
MHVAILLLFFCSCLISRGCGVSIPVFPFNYVDAMTDHTPTIAILTACKNEFTLYGQDGTTFIAKWRHDTYPNYPVKNVNGITGWADVNGELIRVHVCAYSPCRAQWKPSKYGKLPVPRHGQLTKPAVTELTSLPPAVAGPSSLSPAVAGTPTVTALPLAVAGHADTPTILEAEAPQDVGGSSLAGG